jgi:fluoroacetyl-CoA thioesterase
MHTDLRPGLRFQWHYVVPAHAVVPALYDVPTASDMPPVLATGYMVGIMEFACLEAIKPYLDWPREQCLGTQVSFSHLAATPAGMRLRIEGELVEVQGRRLGFRVRAWDEQDLICEGTHERTVVDVARFNEKLAAKIAAPVPSPCRSVCQMEPDSGLCSGCLRTLGEITEWGSATPARRREILAHIDQRSDQRRGQVGRQVGRPAAGQGQSQGSGQGQSSKSNPQQAAPSL